MEPPSQLSKRRGWQIRRYVAGSTTDQFRALGATGIACTARYSLSPCRPITAEYPIAEDEVTIDRAAFFGSVNRTSARLELWGYPSIGDCAREQDFVRQYLQGDYDPPSVCAIVAFRD
jgi:hypothetical protein